MTMAGGLRRKVAVGAAAALGLGFAQTGAANELAVKFGKLESIVDVSLSPDGERLAFIANGRDRSRQLFVVDTREGAVPRAVMNSRPSEGVLSWCGWVTNARLACQAYVQNEVAGDILGAATIFAFDADGQNVRNLANRRSDRSLYRDFRGGGVVDWSSSDGDGSLLMTRSYVPENDTGTRMSSRAQGLGVDRVDTLSGKGRRVVAPVTDAVGYLSDGHGNVRRTAMAMSAS